jgi:hypothetical protein
MEFHPLVEYSDLEHARAQSALVAPFSTADRFPETPNMESMPKAVHFLCRSSTGWGPLTPDYSFTPCFLDGVVMNVANLLILVLGTYQFFVLWERKPLPAKSTWGLATKLVSGFFFFFFSLANLRFTLGSCCLTVWIFCYSWPNGRH